MAAGKLLAQARADALKFATSGGFEMDMTITTPDNATSKNVKGLASGRWEKYDDIGNGVNATKNHVAIPEKVLTDAGYPVRNAAGKVALDKHKVTVSDDNDVARNYRVEEVFPNETTGLIVLMLGKAE